MRHRRCRICLEKLSNFKTLLDTCFWKPKLNYLNVYRKTIKLSAEPGDAYPQFLCFECCDKLEEFYKFRWTAKQSLQKYSKMLVKLRQIEQHRRIEEGYAQSRRTYEENSSLFTTTTQLKQANQYESEVVNMAIDANALHDEDVAVAEEEFLILTKHEQEIEMLDAAIIEGSISPRLNVEKKKLEVSSVSHEWQTGKNLWPQLMRNYQQRQLQQCEICQRHFISEENYVLHMETCEPSHITATANELGKIAKNMASESTQVNYRNDISEMEYQNGLLKNLSSAGTYAFRRKLELRAALRKSIEASLQQNKSKSRKRHRKKLPEIHICETCGKQLPSAISLKQHDRNVHAEKQFMCSVCPRRFCKHAELKRHMTVHTGERKFACPECGLSFRLQSTLLNHIRFHKRDYRYECIPCKRKFIQWSAWNHHNKLHHEDKQFACLHCNKKYARRIDLQMHLKMHNGEFTFACKYCSKTYRYKSSLKLHAEKYHPEEVFADNND